jgi:hypothetical protein
MGLSETVNQRRTEENNGQKRAKGQTSIYKTLHSKLKNKKKPGVNSGVPEG